MQDVKYGTQWHYTNGLNSARHACRMETKTIEFDWINIFVKIALSLIIVISVEVAILLRNQGHINLAQNKRVDQQHWRSGLYLQVEIFLQAWLAELKTLV